MLSANGILNYKLANILVPQISSITLKKFTVKGSFAFAEEIVHQDDKLYMCSLNDDSSFTNIPLEETSNTCSRLLCNDEDVVEKIKRIKNLLLLTTQESHFIFKGILYKQKYSVVMGLPFGPTIANVFL